MLIDVSKSDAWTKDCLWIPQDSNLDPNYLDLKSDMLLLDSCSQKFAKNDCILRYEY